LRLRSLVRRIAAIQPPQTLTYQGISLKAVPQNHQAKRSDMQEESGRHGKYFDSKKITPSW
jgi:hypothetical protein